MSIPRTIAVATVSIVVLVAGVVGLTLLFNSQPQKPALPEQPAVSDLTPGNLLRELNEEREAVGAKPLTIDPLLNESAQLKADEIARTGVFEHTGATGKKGLDYIRGLGADKNCLYISENLAAYTEGAEGTIKGWMTSKPHRDAMLDARYDTTGFGIAGDYRVEHFCDLP